MAPESATVSRRYDFVPRWRGSGLDGMSHIPCRRPSRSGPPRITGVDVMRSTSAQRVVGGFLGALIVAALPYSAYAGAAPRLPDLGAAPLEQMLIQTTSDGTRRLRFTTSIANVGAGPLEIVASRTRRGADWKAAQRIHRADGSTYAVPMQDVQLVFWASEAHGHWHVRGVARYELRRLNDPPRKRTRVKRGFCFFDSRPYRPELPGAPLKESFPRGGCDPKAALELTMGISLGWRDDYYWRIPGQGMDITTLPVGKYRLLVTVDPANWFQESNERNNVTWVDLRIGAQSVKALAHSPPL